MKEARGRRPDPYGKHGMSNSRAYNAWKNMKARCKGYQKQSEQDYVSRGITYCDRWKVFASFYEDMGDPPEEKTLDRVDNDGEYSKENCRWATRSQQQLNQRPIVAHNKSGVKGVCWATAVGKWLVTYRSKFIGYADSLDVGAQMRKKAEENDRTV